MDSPPTPISSQIISEETFNLKENDKNIKLTVIRTTQFIKYNLNEIGSLDIFEGSFTFDDFKKISNVFGIFNSLEEIQNSLNNMFSSNKFELKVINKNQINLNLKINILEKIIDVKIPLIQREISQKEINEKLLNENKKLINEIKLLKEENQLIKSNLQKLQNDFDNFKNEKKNKNENNPFINSKIQVSQEQANLIINRLKLVPQFGNNYYLKFELLYRATRDGDAAEVFHRLCDNKQNILVIVETTKNRKFGGFCSIGYKSKGYEQIDNTAFIFSFDKLKVYNVIKDNCAVYWSIEYGPMFGGSRTVVTNKFLTNLNSANPKNNYYEIPNNYELNGGESTYLIKELEVYQVF